MRLGTRLPALAAVLALLAAGLFVNPGSLALNPRDDDAGTGGDAGDDAESATPLALDTGLVTGRVFGTTDPEDWYALDLEAGQWLQADNPDGEDALVLLDTDARTVFVLPGGASSRPYTYTVPETGTYYLMVHGVGREPKSLSYAFTFEVEDRADSLLVNQPDGWVVAEARVEVPADIQSTTSQVHQDVGTESAAYLWMLELEGTAGGEPVSILDWRYGTMTGNGRTVRVANDPDTELTVLPEHHTRDGVWFHDSEIAQGFVGTLRLTAYRTNPDLPYMATVSSTQPWSEVAISSGPREDVIRWTSASPNPGGDQTLVAPGVSATGARTITIDVPEGDRLAGGFITWNREGYFTPPDGARTPASCNPDQPTCLPDVFTHGTSGRWTFELPEVLWTNVAERPYVDGILLPEPTVFEG